MNPGELDKRVMLQQLVEDKDATGALTRNWVNVIQGGDGKLWARVRDMTGRQFIAAGAKQNEVTTEIRIRLRSGVAASMRVLHRDKTYDIQAVLERDQRWLDLMCAEGVNDG